MVQSNNTHFECLQRIHSTPQKYAMWWFRQFRGNQNYKGSTPAEQNNSSIKAFLGTGGILSLLENINKLIDRHIQHNKDRKHMSNELFVRSSSYNKSPRQGT